MATTEALLVIAGVLICFSAVYFVARNEVIRRRLICPRDGRVAEVDILRRVERPQKRVEVKTCSLFEDPTKVDCEQDCIRQREKAGTHA